MDPDSKKRKMNSASSCGSIVSPLKTSHNSETANLVKQLLAPLEQEVFQLRTLLKARDLEINSLRKKVTMIETQQRSYNFKMYGVNEQQNETIYDTQRIVQNVFKNSGLPPIQMENATRLGKPARFNRPIVVRLIRQSDRDLILAKRHIVRQCCNIFLEEDFSDTIENTRRELRPFITAIKKKQQKDQQRHRVSLHKDKLIVDNKEYGIDDLDKLPEDIKPAKLFTPANNKKVGFFRKYSPLSNHHIAPEKIRNVLYNCNEQFYVHQKAKHFGDHLTAKRIMETTDPAEQKRLSKSIENVNERDWDKIKDSVMKEGLYAKFSQNKDLRDFLLDTGKKEIVECNPFDRYWGVGKSLFDKDVWQNNQLHGNKLGKLLMEIRVEMGTFKNKETII